MSYGIRRLGQTWATNMEYIGRYTCIPRYIRVWMWNRIWCALDIYILVYHSLSLGNCKTGWRFREIITRTTFWTPNEAYQSRTSLICYPTITSFFFVTNSRWYANWDVSSFQYVCFDVACVLIYDNYTVGFNGNNIIFDYITAKNIWHFIIIK